MDAIRVGQETIDPAESLLTTLEARRATLRAELSSVESRLRQLRTADEVCPRCGGLGLKSVRGGLYRELQSVPCSCPGEAES